MGNVRFSPIVTFQAGTPDTKCICGKEVLYSLDKNGWPILNGLEIIEETERWGAAGGKRSDRKFVSYCGSEECKTMIMLQNI